MGKMEEAIKRYLIEHNYNDIGDRFVSFDNRRRPKHQVINLLKAVEENLQSRNGYPYTHVAFEYAQNALKEEKERLKAELENELQRRIDAITNKIRAEYETRLNAIQQQLNEKTAAINKLSQDATEERSRLQNEISGLNNRMVDMGKRQEKEIQQAVQNATSKVTEEYLHKFRGMEDQYKQQNALLQQSNQAVAALQKQVADLASRPTTIVKKGGCFDGRSQVYTPAGIKCMKDLQVSGISFKYCSIVIPPCNVYDLL